MADIRVGTSGWQYDDWDGTFYPDEVAKKRWYEHYATVFPTVEINYSFYRLPRGSTVEGWNRKAPDRFRYAIKGSRYILLANEENLDESGADRLSKLMEANESISVAYLLKEQFRAIHTYRYPGSAKKALLQWCNLAEESGLAPFVRLANGFRKGAEKIVAYCKHRITSGPIEGFNNLVSRVIHRACGIADLNYAWLKFRQLSIQHT